MTAARFALSVLVRAVDLVRLVAIALVILAVLTR